MKNTLALVLIVLGIIGCATTIDTSTPRAQAMMYEARMERLAAEGQDYYRDYKSYCYEQYHGSTSQVSACAEIAAERLSASSENELSIISYLTSNKVMNFIQIRNTEIKAREKQNITNCMIEHVSDYDSRIECLGKAHDSLNQYHEKIANHARIARQEEKVEILIALKQRCNSYGFSRKLKISDCIKREAEFERILAVKRVEAAQKNILAKSTPASKEDKVPWLIEFLGEVVMGVAEAYADPAFHRDVQQQKQINQLKANQNRDIFRNCRPNC
jgi:hypothetical protein